MNTAHTLPISRIFRTRPLMLSAVLVLLGCITARYIRFDVYVLSAVILGLIIVGIVLRRRNRRLFALILVLAMLPLGALRFQLAWNATDPFPEQKDAAVSGRIVEITGFDAAKQRRIAVLEDVLINANPVEGRMRLYLRGDEDSLKDVGIAQIASCSGNIYQADGATNPHEFDFSNFLRTLNINGYVSVKVEDASFVRKSYRLSDIPQLVRGHIANRVDDLFPNQAGIVKAFLIADRSDLSEDMRNDFSRSGVAHLLAVSGMHISILAGILMRVLKRVVHRRTAMGITVFVLLLYGILIGFSSSLIRAIIMFVLYNLSPILGRDADPPTHLAAAMLFNLAVRPLDIMSVSFVLSYSASAGIVFLSAPMWQLLHLEGLRNGKPARDMIGRIKTRLPRYPAQSLVLTLSAQIATLPAVIHNFGAQPLWGIASNLIAVPLAMCAYVISIIATITGIRPIACCAEALFELLGRFAHAVGNLPLSTLRVARFPVWLIILSALTLFCASELIRTPRKIAKYLPLIVVPAVIISNLCAQSTLAGCSIVFMDAGEADCAIVRCENHVYLVDAGDNYTPAVDYISAMNYDIDAVFLTHPHADHAAGLNEILTVCTPEKVYISENWDHYEAAQSVQAAMDTLNTRNVPIERISSGDTLQLSDKTFVRVLSPTAGICAKSANDDSLVLQLEYGDAAALLCGDTSAKHMPEDLPGADIMKVAHHGGKGVLNDDILDAVSPSVAILSVEAENSSHPADETLAFLAKTDAKIYRTDECGAITCRLRTDGSIETETYLQAEDRK